MKEYYLSSDDDWNCDINVCMLISDKSDTYLVAFSDHLQEFDIIDYILGSYDVITTWIPYSHFISDCDSDYNDETLYYDSELL